MSSKFFVIQHIFNRFSKVENIIFRHQFLKFIQIKIRMLKLSGELITDLNLIIQVKMMFVFQICSDIKLMDKQKYRRQPF